MHHCDNRVVISVRALVFLAAFSSRSNKHPSPTSNKDLILEIIFDLPIGFSINNITSL